MDHFYLNTSEDWYWLYVLTAKPGRLSSPLLKMFIAELSSKESTTYNKFLNCISSKKFRVYKTFVGQQSFSFELFISHTRILCFSTGEIVRPLSII
jgi:hypothetical protein